MIFSSRPMYSMIYVIDMPLIFAWTNRMFQATERIVHAQQQ